MAISARASNRSPAKLNFTGSVTLAPTCFQNSWNDSGANEGDWTIPRPTSILATTSLLDLCCLGPRFVCGVANPPAESTMERRIWDVMGWVRTEIKLCGDSVSWQNSESRMGQVGGATYEALSARDCVGSHTYHHHHHTTTDNGRKERDTQKHRWELYTCVLCEYKHILLCSMSFSTSGPSVTFACLCVRE